MARIATYCGVLAILSSAILLAQSTAPAGLPGTIEGRVSNAVTGEPVASATVHLFPFGRRGATAAQAQTTSSQPDGVFRFDSVQQGVYFLSAEANGYVAAGARWRAHRLTVDSGQQVTNVVVQLNPQGTIAGKVLDENGQPVPGARVQAYTTYVMRGKLQLRRGSSTTADKAGGYTLKKLNPGKYYLSAELPRSPKSSKGQTGQAGPERTETPEPAAASDMGFVRTFYPGVLDVQSATPFEITPGEQAAETDLRLRRAMTYQVRGRLAPPDGALWRATVLLSPRDTIDANALGMSTRLAKDGTFELKNVLPGSYTLWLIGTYSSGQSSPPRYMGFRLLGRQDLDVSASNVGGIVLSLTPPVNLTGHVAAEGIDKQQLSQMRVNVVPAGQVMMGNFQSAALDQDGNFALQNLAPGTYSVRVSSTPAGAYVKDITYNRQDITASGLDLSLGGAGEIEIEIRSGAGEVDGTIQTSDSGNAGPGEIVVLVPDNIGADGYGMLTSPVSGNTFAVKNVPPGHYYAYAVTYWDSVWQNSDFLHEIQREGTSIEMEENARKQVDLPVVSSDDVQVTAARLGLTAQ